MEKYTFRGFTLVELIVVVTILAILGTIAFISFQGYTVSARDTKRLSDINLITTDAHLFYTEFGRYPQPTNFTSMTFSGSVLWNQGTYGKDTIQYSRRIIEAPTDPLTGDSYPYSTTQSTGEYQIGSIMESGNSISLNLGIPQTYAVNNQDVFSSTILRGNYNGKFIIHTESVSSSVNNIYVLGVPSLFTSNISIQDLNQVHTNNLFVYPGTESAPASYAAIGGSGSDSLTMNLVSSQNPNNLPEVIYQSTSDEISSAGGKIQLIENLQDYYKGTLVENSASFSDIKNIGDSSVNQTEAVNLVNTFIQNGIGGLSQRNNIQLTSLETPIEESGTSQASLPIEIEGFCGGDYNSQYNNYGGYDNSPGFTHDDGLVALKSDGSVVTWGEASGGGDSSSVASQLSSGVEKVFSNRNSFAALKSDGSVVTWGEAGRGGDSSSVASQLSSGVEKIFSTSRAFAALKADGSVVTWGEAGRGGDSSSVASQLSSGVEKIFSNPLAFAALKADGSVVTWGEAGRGGDSSSVASQLSSGVEKISSTGRAFAALKSDGSVVTWGEAGRGGDSSSVASQLSSGVEKIFSVDAAFAVLKSDGSVITWGASSWGADSSSVASQLSSGVEKISSTLRAFAALKSDGSVVTWGDSTYGGDSTSVASQLSSGVEKIFSNAFAFAALKSDGSVVTWGNTSRGGDSTSAAPQLSSGVEEIFSNGQAFAALKSDGSVVTWGNTFTGGDSSSIASQLSSGVEKVFSNPSSFVALKSDGSVITWGASFSGGNSSSVASQLSSGVVSINGTSLTNNTNCY